MGLLPLPVPRPSDPSPLSGSVLEAFLRSLGAALPAPAPPAPAPRGPFLSVLVRTQGARNANLLEALTCLAAQTFEDFEVLVLVHRASADAAREVRGLVAGFAPGFRERVRLFDVNEGGRARPLNVGLEAARGEYVAFLDEDDLALAHWAETFARGAEHAPGRVVRSQVVDRAMSRPGPGAVAPHVARGPLHAPYRARFDLSEHLNQNETPICALAVPLALVRTLGLRFDERLPVMEDWAFLLRAAMYAGVHDSAETTSVYHRWDGAEASVVGVPAEVWRETHARVLRELDQAPLLLPPGSAARLARLHAELEHLHRESLRRHNELRYKLVDQANLLLKRAVPALHRRVKDRLAHALRSRRG